MASKPINSRWIKTGSRPYQKIIHSTELQTIFYEHNINDKINTSFVSPGLRPIWANLKGFSSYIFLF